MNTMPVEIEELLDRRLREANLSRFVNKEQSQFLDFPDQLFVEIVLNDATFLGEVEKIIRHTAQELKARDIKLDSVIRAVWEIVDVNYFGPSRSADGGLRAAYEFHVTLKSGDRQHHAFVDVFWGAVEFLEQKLGLQKFLARPGEAKGHLDEEMVAKTVRSFVQHQLSLGGISYWDPLLYPRLEMNDAAMLFVLGQSTSFNELRQAVSDAFDPSVVDSFFSGLAASRVKIRNFDAVLPELSNLLGGAYRRGQTFSTNASELFQKLNRAEQELLKNYFYARVERLKAESSEIVRKFSAAFS
jgi:hypothetical protein